MEELKKNNLKKKLMDNNLSLIELDDTADVNNSANRSDQSTSSDQSFSSPLTPVMNNNFLQNSAVSVQKISFFAKSPKAWFRILETQFTNASITTELTKFSHAISMMDPDTIDRCIDIIETLPTDTPYTEFKNKVIERMSVSEQSKLQKVLSETEMGDRKPSELLTYMTALAQGSLSDNVVKTLWLNRLPPQVRAILIASSENLPKLSSLADKIFETVPSQSIASTAHVASASGIDQQIAQLTKRFDEFQRSFSNKGHGRSRSKSRTRNRSRSKSKSKDDTCYFHRKFGEQARNCTNWCKFKKDSASNSGNGRTGRQ